LRIAEPCASRADTRRRRRIQHDLCGLDQLAFARGWEGKRQDRPSDRQKRGHPASFGNQRVAGDRVGLGELHQSMRQQAMDLQDIAAAGSLRRREKAGDFPNVRSSRSALRAEVGKNRAQHVRPSGRQQTHGAKVPLLIVYGDDVDGKFIVELIHLEPTLTWPDTPAECVDEHSLAMMVHFYEGAATLETVRRPNDPNLSSLIHGGIIRGRASRPNPCSHRGSCAAARCGIDRPPQHELPMSQIPSPADFGLASPPRQPRWACEADPFEKVGKPGCKELAHIPGRRGLPIAGILPEAVLSPMGFAQRMHRRYGRVYRFYACGSWNVQLVGPEANELVLFDRDSIFSAHGGWSPVIEPFFPGALLIQDGERHRANRRILGEAFRQQKLAGYRAIFDADIRDEIGSWRGRTIDVYDAVKRLTLRIAASTFLGISMQSRCNEAIQAFADMMGGLVALSHNPWLSGAARRGYRAKAMLERFILDLIAQKRRAPGEDILSRICTLEASDGDALTDKEIHDSIIFLLAAAHDTLASAFTSLIYYLALQPEWQKNLREELSRELREAASDARFAPLPLQDMCFKEALRLNAPAPVIWRRATRPFSIYGYDVPAGTITGVSPLLVHLDPDIWENPTEFNPLHFEPEAEASRHRHAFVPFGGGVHKCLGLHFATQQTRVFLSHLVSELDLSLISNQRARWYHWPNCRPRGRLLVSARARSPRSSAASCRARG
jgi:cytochrome P450